MSEINLGEYISFCKDFNIPVSKAKITEVFKKSSDFHKPHKFENFSNSLTKLGVEYNSFKIDETKKKILEIEEEIKKSE